MAKHVGSEQILTERFLIAIGFRVTHCGWMQMGYMRVSGPPASSKSSEWMWHVGNEPLPKRLQPKTEPALLALLSILEPEGFPER